MSLNTETINSEAHNDETSSQYELILSEAAVKRLEQVTKNKPAGTFLRVELVAGGCQGFNVKFSLDSTLQQDDIKFIQNGQTIVSDTVSLEIISGSTVEYSSNLMGNYFWLNVKNAKQKCSCGSSFSF